MVIPHYSYMILKMSCPQGVITIRTDYQGATYCFWGAIQTALTVRPSVALPTWSNDKQAKDDLTIPLNEASVVTSMRPTEETKRINIRFSDERKTTVISSSLTDNRKALVQFLQDNRDMFAWQPVDMLGVRRDVVEHQLKVYSQAKPIRQKQCCFTPKKREAIRAELARRVSAGFIREVLRPEWLANPVLVLKKNKVEWCMCV
jgi:hypothetical protein